MAPDVVWISHARLDQGLGEDGKLHAAPELVVEVLSPGSTNERRDRGAKRKLYALEGVAEYWIVDWRTRTVEVYRRAGDTLELVAPLTDGDTLTSPLLPGFAYPTDVESSRDTLNPAATERQPILYSTVVAFVTVPNLVEAWSSIIRRP